MDHRDKQHLTPLQPACLNELTRLTRLSFKGLNDPTGNPHRVDGAPYAFELPELKDLCLKCLWARHLKLQCTQLKLLQIESCAIRKLSLQASLEHLHHEDSALVLIHKGFPITNLIGLTYLSLDGGYDTKSEAMVFQELPLMTRLQFLELHIGMCSLPANLPSTLRDLTLFFSADRVWDSSAIPLLQQLPEAESMCIYIHPKHKAFIGVQSLDHDLRPFLAMKSLEFLQLGDSQIWKASALSQLGELEAEVVRTGKKLQLRY